LVDNWHRNFLESIEENFHSDVALERKYCFLNSNRKRLYLPYAPGIKRREVLSNPDILLQNNKTDNIEYIIEVEYQVNYKKIAGIAVMTDVAVGQMGLKSKPKLMLLVRKSFPNMKLMQNEIQARVRNIRFSLYDSSDFISKISSLIS